MGENEMALEALKWIAQEIEERKKESEREKNDDFSKGQSLAYFEMSDIIKSRLDILGIDLDK